jgi:hypothetical protein
MLWRSWILCAPFDSRYCEFGKLISALDTLLAEEQSLGRPRRLTKHKIPTRRHPMQCLKIELVRALENFDMVVT